MEHDQKLVWEALEKSFSAAIQHVGLEAFKELSFFVSAHQKTEHTDVVEKAA